MSDLTPRERYLEEKERIDEKNREMNGDVTKEEKNVIDEELDKMEQEEIRELEMELEKLEGVERSKNIDKNMGSEKHGITMTREEHLEQKELEESNKALVQLKKATANHLSNEDKKDMQDVLNGYRDEKIEDPVLKHLVLQKGELAKKYMEDTKKVKVLHEKLLKEMTELTNNIVKTKGAIENVDKQILQVYRRSISS